MSAKATVRNLAKALPGRNVTRPHGASALAESTRPDHLWLAATEGNRATRRLALRNLTRLARQEGAP